MAENSVHTSIKHKLIHSPCLRPSDWLRFVHLDPFAGQWRRLGLPDDHLSALELCIMAAGNSPPVIPGTHGVRKVRWVYADAEQGKSGSYRVFYVHFKEYGIVGLMAVLSKKERDNLSMSDRSEIGKVVLEIQRLLDRGVIR